MKFWYAIDKENNIVYCVPEARKEVEGLGYTIIEGKVPEDGPIVMPELLLIKVDIDTKLMKEKLWQFTHPNGLVYFSGGKFVKTTASYAYTKNLFVATAWHVAMQSVFEKNGIITQYVNTPVIAQIKNIGLRLPMITPPAVYKGTENDYHVFEVNTDLALFYGNLDVVTPETKVLGKPACVYGVISGSIYDERRRYTWFGFNKPEDGCDGFQKDLELKVAGARTGLTKGKIVNVDHDILFYVNDNVRVRYKNAFIMDVITQPGDSGGPAFYYR